MAVMMVMKVMVVMAVMAVVTASDSIDVGVMMSGAGDVKGEVMINAALLNVSGGGNGANRDSRVSTSCCTGSGCSSFMSCTMSDAVCLSGFETASGTHLEGCASRTVCDRYAKAYACDSYNTEAYTGYCCCSTSLCNVNINTCKAETLYKCRTGAVTVAGRLGGLTALLALLLPLLLA